MTFHDITPLLGDPDAFRFAVDAIADQFSGVEIDRVIGIEARGFILAAPLAYRRGASFVPIRKAGKLPWAVAREEYVLEYGTDKLEIHRDAILPGERVLIVDDVLATGGHGGGRRAPGRGSGRRGRRARLRSSSSSISGGRDGLEVRTRWRASSPTRRSGAADGHRRSGPAVAAARARRRRRRSRPSSRPSVAVTRRRPIATIVRAYEVAAEAHEHQYRKSGEKYINHPISVAKVVADIGLDDTTVAAALLHDAVEDTEVTTAEIEEQFGAEVAPDRRRRHQARADPVRLPARSSRPPPCARCSWRWPRTCAS